MLLIFIDSCWAMNYIMNLAVHVCLYGFLFFWGGGDKIMCTVLLLWEGCSALSMHPEEYPLRKGCKQINNFVSIYARFMVLSWHFICCTSWVRFTVWSHRSTLLQAPIVWSLHRAPWLHGAHSHLPKHWAPPCLWNG